MTTETLALLLVATPGAAFLVLSLLWLLGIQLSERLIAGLTRLLYLLLLGLAGALVWRMWSNGLTPVRVSVGEWFRVADYHFPLALRIDRLSLPLVGATVVLSGVVSAFSVRYLHRDPGFFRFFLLQYLFTFGALLVFTADSLDLLLGGWELVGITSVLLIGFFQYRPDPVRNALRVFGIYRIADLGLLLAVFFAHHGFHTASWDGLFPTGAGHAFDGGTATLVAVLLVFAASGKSAQGPFCGWLVRAMEGPTPSSAVFYGAISVHAGAYLLLRIEPLLRASWVATVLVVFIGLTTALLGTLVHRTCADAKTSLAYASQTQLGLIFAEIGLGWTTFAVIHLVSHALLRTLQFLRSPSMLRDYHRVHAAAGGRIDPTGEHYESLLPKPVQVVLYRAALGRGFYDAVLDRFIVRPFVVLARGLGWFEPGSTSADRTTPTSLTP
jgi:NADH:ubiquinone oxidoreductase subunit 5 (subunit L)/multisubunit Na+/H+ antiporter MnhA subunit